jgi:hypothetical protein
MPQDDHGVLLLEGLENVEVVVGQLPRGEELLVREEFPNVAFCALLPLRSQLLGVKGRLLLAGASYLYLWG